MVPILNQLAKIVKNNTLEVMQKNIEKKEKSINKCFCKRTPNYIKQWKIDNRDRINKRERKRRQTDINFKLKKNISRAIGHAILKDGNSAIKFLPYTISDLKCHLEVQFDKNMT